MAKTPSRLQRASAYIVLGAARPLLSGTFCVARNSGPPQVQNAAARVVLYLGLRDITWHQRWSSYTGWLPVEHRIKIQAVYASNSNWAYTTVTTALGSRWIQSSTRSEVRQHCRLHTSNVRRTGTKFGERCFSHAGPWSCLEFLTWQQAYYTDANRLFKKSFKNSSRVLKFVSAPGHFVSRAI